MSSKIDVCNLALTYLGSNPIMDSLDETIEAQRLLAIYDISRRAMIESFPWNFATKRATLALLEEVPDHKYAYFFALPEKCLRVIRLNDRDTEYRVEGKKIATNDGEVQIEYLEDVTDEEQFPSSFVEALAAKLAYELSIPMTDKEGIMDRMQKLFEAKYSKASFNDSQQGTPKPLVRNSWIETRGA